MPVAWWVGVRNKRRYKSSFDSQYGQALSVRVPAARAPHVAKARIGDLGPGRGGIRPLALTQKTVVTQRRVGGIQSCETDLQWRTLPDGREPLPVRT
jgi:hypothetical protein